MARPPSKFSNEGSSLDLGLSALLDSSAKAPPAALAPRASEEPPTPEVHSTPEPLSEFEELVEGGQWKALSQRCDKLLPPQVSADERLELLETRFWWARSQQQLEAVPLSILAAPLEDIARKLHSALELLHPLAPGQRLFRLKAEVASTLAEVAAVLTKQGEREIGERLAQLGSSFRGVRLKEPEGHRPMPQAETPQAPATVRHEIPDRRPPRGLDSRERLRSGFQPAPELAQSQSGGFSPTNSRPSSRRFVLLALLGVAVASVLVFKTPNEDAILPSLGKTFLGGEEEQVLTKKPLRDGITAPELRVSEPKLVTGVNQLDSILEDIKNDRSQLADLKQRPPAGLESSNSRPPSTVSSTEPTSETGLGAATGSPSGVQGRGQKERIDMTGPREPANFPGAGRQGSGVSGPDLRRPDDVRRGPSSRPSGSAERPGFEDFKRPRTYRTLIETDVMSHPTIRGRVLDTLPGNVEVLVEGREGYWLRVRSQKGNVGYILAQDANRQE
jgi:hypothetical protein